jgi:rubredoxin
MDCPDCGASNSLTYDEEYDQYDCDNCGNSFDAEDIEEDLEEY